MLYMQQLGQPGDIPSHFLLIRGCEITSCLLLVVNVLPLSLLWYSVPGDVLCSTPSEGSEQLRKKSRLDIDTLTGDDVHKPQLDIDISDTRKCV